MIKKSIIESINESNPTISDDSFCDWLFEYLRIDNLKKVMYKPLFPLDNDYFIALNKKVTERTNQGIYELIGKKQEAEIDIYSYQLLENKLYGLTREKINDLILPEINEFFNYSFEMRDKIFGNPVNEERIKYYYIIMREFIE